MNVRTNLKQSCIISQPIFNPTRRIYEDDVMHITNDLSSSSVSEES